MSRSLASLRQVPLSEVSGVGAKLASGLAKMGLDNVADLLWHVPRRYVDFSTQSPIADVRTGEEVTVVAEVKRVSTRRPRRNLTIVEATLFDGSGALTATWFNQEWLARKLKVGSQWAFSGKVERFRGRPQMRSPAFEQIGGDGDESGLETGRIVPVHPASGDAPAWRIRQLARAVIADYGDVADPFPADLVARHHLVSRATAFRQIHFPDDDDSRRAARRRLVYDELLILEAGLALRKQVMTERQEGMVQTVGGPLAKALRDRLPYRLTAAQERALDEIGADLASPRPMHRLLQGEVGSGKTVVAAEAMLAAVDSGRQAAMMAPTEVLAEQHAAGLRSLLDGLRTPGGDDLFGFLRVGLLTNRTTGAERRQILDDVAAGRTHVLVGTHALIQEGVSLDRLGVVVVDEQHRFGVHQRVALRDKAVAAEGDALPDVLIMTATPIPRTLAITLYGDLDVTVLDELPPGRRPIETRVVGPDPAGRERVYDHVRGEVAAGRQAYVVCPLVEESETLEARSATAEHERLSAEVFPDLRCGLLHGQMRAADKAAAFEAFRAGETDVLVATTVIEVGVDVPNATVMIVEDADRFGLSQLHQLRGRIGRGAHASVCFLFADPQTDEAAARMRAVAETSDGFLLAEEDLRIRGEGSLFDARQSGRGDLRVASLLRDMKAVEAARRDAFALVAADPGLASSAHDGLLREVREALGDDVEWLMKS